MNISRTSWHYKLLEHFNWLPWDRYASFCEYFWKVVGALFIVAVVAPIVATGMILDVFTVYIMWANDVVLPEGQGPGDYLLNDYFGLSFETYPVFYVLLTVSLGLGLMAWLAIAVVVFFITIMYLHGKYEDRRIAKRASGTTQEPNIFVQWAKARKDKLCPIINYKD